MGCIAHGTCTGHEVFDGGLQKVENERFIKRGGRHEVITGELARQGNTFQVDSVEYVPVAVEPCQTSKKCLTAPIWPRRYKLPR
jgi:hypothetical protein